MKANLKALLITICGMIFFLFIPILLIGQNMALFNIYATIAVIAIVLYIESRNKKKDIKH